MIQLRGVHNPRLGIYETHAAGNRTWCQGRQRLQSVTGINHHKTCPVPLDENAGRVVSHRDTRQREVMYLFYADIRVQFIYLSWGVPTFQGSGVLGRGHFSDHALKGVGDITQFSADWSSDQRAGLVSKLHADQHVTQPCPEHLKGSVWLHKSHRWFLRDWLEVFSQQRKVPEIAQWEMTASQLLPAYSSPAEFWVIDLHFQGRWCKWFKINWQWPIVKPCKTGTYSLTFLFCMNCESFPSNLPCSSWPLLKKQLFFFLKKNLSWRIQAVSTIMTWIYVVNK